MSRGFLSSVSVVGKLPNLLWNVGVFFLAWAARIERTDVVSSISARSSGRLIYVPLVSQGLKAFRSIETVLRECPSRSTVWVSASKTVPLERFSHRLGRRRLAVCGTYKSTMYARVFFFFGEGNFFFCCCRGR